MDGDLSSESIMVPCEDNGADVGGGGGDSTVVLLEPRPFRPFKSSEEYLIAMKEDLADWLHRLYPDLDIYTDNFMQTLEDGVVLCKHANSVRQSAMAYRQKVDQQQGKLTDHYNIPDRDVLYRAEVKAGSFFARDNVHNFIQWCRCLGIYQCLLFETDDLVMRKNEKSFILCLLEVARRGARFGMPAPLLVQFEQEIDRELEIDENNQNQNSQLSQGDADDDVGAGGAEFGPVAQIVTNDLRSLDEIVRDLVEHCSCPTQFPMIRVSEGKYRIGETKLLIFVRVLRNHVVVRVGGGWDTLSHYLDKHDPCRCRAGHRTPVASKLSISNNSRGATQMQVTYERASSPSANPSSRRSSGASISGSISARKNSIISAFNSTPESPSIRHRSRQRSQSPNSRISLRNRSQSPGHSPNFKRSSSGRQQMISPFHYPSHSPSNSTLHPYQQPSTTTIASPQCGNMDSLESYDSGIGHISPGSLRKCTVPLDELNGTRIGGLNSGTDSSSEVSDEGYRTGAGMSHQKADEVDERPGSSCTQLSQGSSTESGVSLVDKRLDSGECKKSKIPLYVSPPSDRRRSMPRSNSTSNEVAGHVLQKDGVGRHSLRLKNETDKPRKNGIVSPTKSGTSTWNGRNNKRERLSLTQDLFQPPTPSSPVMGRVSRSVASNSSQFRATSASPHSRRQYLNQSIAPTSPSASPEVRRNSGTGGKYPKSQTMDNVSKNLLCDMLDEVDIDNDVSILKRMEKIVNQYKARVEGLLAAEGKTLDDDPMLDEIPLADSTSLNRRSSLDSNASNSKNTSVRRKDRTTSIPSRIPMPRFMR